MKVILDIESNALEIIKKEGIINSENRINNVWVVDELIDALDNVVILPNNATNGDMIMAMFTKGKVRREVSCTHDKTVFSFPDGTYFGAECRFNTDWWNAPYKTESEG